jgi:hypothetical protein
MFHNSSTAINFSDTFYNIPWDGAILLWKKVDISHFTRLSIKWSSLSVSLLLLFQKLLEEKKLIQLKKEIIYAKIHYLN